MSITHIYLKYGRLKLKMSEIFTEKFKNYWKHYHSQIKNFYGSNFRSLCHNDYDLM